MLGLGDKKRFLTDVLISTICLNTVDQLIFTCLNFREFVIWGLFTEPLILNFKKTFFSVIRRPNR